MKLTTVEIYEELLHRVEAQIPDEFPVARRGCRRAILAAMYEDVLQQREETDLPPMTIMKKQAS